MKKIIILFTIFIFLLSNTYAAMPMIMMMKPYNPNNNSGSTLTQTNNTINIEKTEIQKYKKSFSAKLLSKIGKLSDEKINDVIKKIDILIDKYSLSKLTQAKKDKVIYQLKALKEILNNQLFSRKIIEKAKVKELEKTKELIDNKKLICQINEHIENDVCILNIKSCNIINGIGEQAFILNKWANCEIKSCYNGYENKNGSCILIDENSISNNQCVELKENIDELKIAIDKDQSMYNKYNSEIQKLWNIIVSKIRRDLYSRGVDASKIPVSQIIALSGDLGKKLISDGTYKELIRVRKEYSLILEKNKALSNEAENLYNNDCK